MMSSCVTTTGAIYVQHNAIHWISLPLSCTVILTTETAIKAYEVVRAEFGATANFRPLKVPCDQAWEERVVFRFYYRAVIVPRVAIMPRTNRLESL